MPQESNYNSVFSPPSKNLRGLKGLNSLVNNNNNNGNGISDASSYAEEIINDRELAQRRAGEAGNIKLRSHKPLKNYFFDYTTVLLRYISSINLSLN